MVVLLFEQTTVDGTLNKPPPRVVSCNDGKYDRLRAALSCGIRTHVNCQPNVGLLPSNSGCHGLVVKARLPWRKDTGSNPVPTEDLPYPWAFGTLKHKLVIPLVWCGILRGECQFRCHPRHQTIVQNCKVRPKIALIFLKNWMLIKLKQSDSDKLVPILYHSTADE
ncbi:hypothetical protein AVEN_59509-1 [Araneus ventricosus]|uniref:Uncharacterized protein n=1 Tax=Araneus ventricosus TaxID=182803 RepID=A0A4Y2NPC4_ARAVE|nr:hypothetical protein AVEN_59509-1 [Araneus ventricosus]